MDVTRDVVAGAVRWMLLNREDIHDPEPTQKLGIAMLFATSALRDVLLFDETWAGSEEDLGVEVLVEELLEALRASVWNRGLLFF
jgi:hypothetical protein